MYLLRVAFQIPLQAKALAASLALVLVLAYVFHHGGLLTEPLATSSTFQRELRLLPLDLILSEILSSRLLSAVILLFYRCARQLSFPRDLTFLPAG